MDNLTSETMLTVEEAAARLRVSQWTIRRAIRRGELSATKTSSARNGRWRIPASSFATYTAPSS
ncbi:helix-turn-helix domain-containing protein [Streptosporangium sp. NPDC001559]|uniref:Helix-turn-helix domain-containing protein n=1 Tax=Streptosporangium jomthongense TaxID=1193683 RepID=A0ABV8EYR4_9ACTN